MVARRASTKNTGQTVQIWIPSLSAVYRSDTLFSVRLEAAEERTKLKEQQRLPFQLLS